MLEGGLLKQGLKSAAPLGCQALGLNLAAFVLHSPSLCQIRAVCFCKFLSLGDVGRTISKTNTEISPKPHRVLHRTFAHGRSVSRSIFGLLLDQIGSQGEAQLHSKKSSNIGFKSGPHFEQVLSTCWTPFGRPKRSKISETRLQKRSKIAQIAKSVIVQKP